MAAACGTAGDCCSGDACSFSVILPFTSPAAVRTSTCTPTQLVLPLHSYIHAYMHAYTHADSVKQREPLVQALHSGAEATGSHCMHSTHMTMIAPLPPGAAWSPSSRRGALWRSPGRRQRRWLCRGARGRPRRSGQTDCRCLGSRHRRPGR